MSTESVPVTVICTEHHHGDERDAESRRLIEELREEIRKLAEQPKYELIDPWMA